MESLFIEDLNGDGMADAAAANRFGDDVSVLFGVGDGDLAVEKRFPVGVRPVSIAGGDFDEDGKLDLITANEGSGDVSLLRGDGDGTFAKESRVATGLGASSVAVGDFNSDGHWDVAVAGGSMVSVLWGAGDGTFPGVAGFDVGGSAEQVVAADVDNDGSLDLITVNNGSGDISVLLWTEPTFGSQNRIAVGSDPKGLSVADLDADGAVDVIVTRRSRGAVEVLFGTGDGRFGNPVSIAVGASPESLAVADFDGDGHLDIAVSSGGVSGQRSSVQLIMGMGVRGFAPRMTLPTGGAAIESLAAADATGDGRPDLLVGKPSLLGVYDGMTVRDLAERSGPTTGQTPGALAIADLDNDDALDVVVGNTNDLSILWGNADGTFASEQRHALGIRPDSLTLTDLDSDGLNEIVVGHGGDDGLIVLGNLGSRGFGDATYVDADRSPGAVAVADFNSDGSQDLAVANTHSDSNYLSVVDGTADGTFGAPQRFYLDGRPKSVQSGDWNGDGKPDLVVITVSGVCLQVASGNGTLSDPTCVSHPGPHVGLCLGHFNGDELVDAAAVTSDLMGGSSVYVHLGDEAGHLGEAVALAADYKPIALACADIDGDSVDDIIVTSAGGTQAQVRIASGDGSFSAQTRFALDEQAGQIALADVDADCRVDFVATLPVLDRVQVVTSSP